MKNPSGREAILYSYSIESTHDQATLERYLRKYPELARDLVDLSAEIRLSEEFGPSNVGPDTDKNWKSAFEEFLACGEKKEVQTVVNPFERFRGVEFVRLVQALNVSRSFLTAFRDGLAVATTIPEPFLSRLADAMSSSLEELQAFLSSPQLDLSWRTFKSEQKPAHQGQRTFEELVHSSDMTDEQRQILLRDIRDDGLNRSKPTKG